MGTHTRLVESLKRLYRKNRLTEEEIKLLNIAVEELEYIFDREGGLA